MNRSNDIKVSVIVLTYNQEHTVGRTIESILSQKTEYPFEIIIGEDASPSDNTRAVCQGYAEKYPDVISLMPKAPNKGLLKNYADCLRECRGKYIAGCAGDDWWHNPDKIQLQIEFLEKNIEFGLVYTDYDVYNTSTNQITISFNRTNAIKRPSGSLYDILFRGNVIGAGTAMFRKYIFDQYVDLDSYIACGFMMEDYPMWLAMSRVSKFQYLDISTLSYTLASGSESNCGENIERFDNLCQNVMLIRRYFLNITSSGISSDRNDKFIISLYNSSLFSYCLVQNNRELAKKYGWKLFRTSPNVTNFIKVMICYIPFIFQKLSNRAFSKQ